MKTNRKLLAFLLVLIIIGITPASASKISEIQKEGDYINTYTHEGGWYKFCHFFDFCVSISNLIALSNSVGDEMDVYSKQNEKQMLEVDKSNKELRNQKNNLKILSNYYAEDFSKNNALNVSKSNKTNIKHSISTIKEYKINDTYISAFNKSENRPDNNSFNNDTDVQNNKTNMETPENLLSDDADNVKNDLNKTGVNVNVENVKLKDIQNKSIVQLLNGNGYIKYMVYLGTKTVDNESYVKLFNGQNECFVLFNKFKKDYKGIILKFLGSNNEDILSEFEVCEKIYDNKLAYLDSNIDYHNNWLIAANVLKGIGVGLSLILMVLTITASILLAFPDPTLMTKVLALNLYLIAIAGFILAAAVYIGGLAIESVSTSYKNMYISEKTDLETFKL